MATVTAGLKCPPEIWPNAKIAAYADKQLQVKGGILIGIWDEAELAAIRQKLGINS